MEVTKTINIKDFVVDTENYLKEYLKKQIDIKYKEKI